jgi:predicted RNase H-like HicB family nuclease
MKTYSFKVVVEPDDDRWHAYCPALEDRGASTWGCSREEALKHIDEVVQLVVDSMSEHGESLPEESTNAPCLLPPAAGSSSRSTSLTTD